MRACKASVLSAVMRGLDPRIHLKSEDFLSRWIAGSSPAMTMEASSAAMSHRRLLPAA
jgi:hypothetical protein